MVSTEKKQNQNFFVARVSQKERRETDQSVLRGDSEIFFFLVLRERSKRQRNGRRERMQVERKATE